MQLHHFPSKDETAKAAAAALASLLNQPSPILLLLASGSSLGLLDHLKATELSKRITIGMIDERYDINSAINNFAQMSVTPFAQVAAQRGASFIDSRVQTGETLEQFARRLESAWKAWTTQYPNGNIIATLGMGADGHTVGIMPYPENKALFKRLFDDVKRWVVGYDVESKHQYRLRATATLPFLRIEVDAAIVYVVGDDKRQGLARVVAEDGGEHETPARAWRDMRNLQVFTDINYVKESLLI